jgi:hypothetical protein
VLSKALQLVIGSSFIQLWARKLTFTLRNVQMSEEGGLNLDLLAPILKTSQGFIFFRELLPFVFFFATNNAFYVWIYFKVNFRHWYTFSPYTLAKLALKFNFNTWLFLFAGFFEYD